jgi:hypothetical protein
MVRLCVILLGIIAYLCLPLLSAAQQAQQGQPFPQVQPAPQVQQVPQKYRLPDLKSLKRLTTSSSDHAPDIPGKETTMDFYSAPSGDMITVYSYSGRSVAFSTYKNSDMQNTYRIFMDLTGDGWFQEINRGAQWQLPAWVRRPY